MFKKVDARARRAHHLRQRLLGNLRDNTDQPVSLAVARQQHDVRASCFARIKELVDEILLNPTVAGEYVAKSNGTNAQQKAPEKSGLNPEKRLS